MDACIVPKDIPGAIKMIERRWEELERKYRELERVYQQKGWPDAFRETVNEMRERMDAARKQKDAVRKKGAKINRAEQELLNWAAKVARGFGASMSAADPHLDAFNVLLGLPVPARDDLPKRGRPREGASKLDGAVADVARIRDLWQQTFGKRYRSQPPTAIEIAARASWPCVGAARGLPQEQESSITLTDFGRLYSLIFEGRDYFFDVD